MRLAVVGSRRWKDRQRIIDWLEEELAIYQDSLVIVSGGARGVDQIAEEWADKRGVTKIIIPCTAEDWSQQGKIAGFLRNRSIVHNADQVCAFWDGLSSGTANTIAWAIYKRVPVSIFLEEQP